MTPQMYVDLAATGDMFEIESSKLALINSDNKDVKDFARHMVQDHTEAADKLKGVIKDKSVGVGLPAKLDDAHLEMLDKLQAAKGQDFDRLYLKMQQEGHQQALKLHQAYADNGDAAELKTYATVMVPIIEKHLTAVDRLARAVKGNT
jgi:putative membrane protein